MRPNILHNKLHPTDYDRIAFIEDHYEDLKEMYTTIMEHLKIPMGGTGGGSIDLFPSTYTTDNYFTFKLSNEAKEYLKLDTEEHRLQVISICRLSIIARIEYNYFIKYSLAPQIEDDCLLFPRVKNMSNADLSLPINNTNLIPIQSIGLYNDTLENNNTFTINVESGAMFDITPEGMKPTEEKTFLSNYLPTLSQVCNAN